MFFFFLSEGVDCKIVKAKMTGLFLIGGIKIKANTLNVDTRFTLQFEFK